MPSYVRKDGSKVIHLVTTGRETTRCFPGRYDTSDWEHLTPGDRDWGDICKNCLKEPDDPTTFYPLRREENAIRATMSKTNKRG